jgi:hypothetical protein
MRIVQPFMLIIHTHILLFIIFLLFHGNKRAPFPANLELYTETHSLSFDHI